MNPIIRRITENRLSDFKGLSIEGEIPVSEEILNEMLQLFLHQKKKPQKTGEPASPSSSGEDSPDISQIIIESLDENDVKIELKEKQAVLKVTVRKY